VVLLADVTAELADVTAELAAALLKYSVAAAAELVRYIATKYFKSYWPDAIKLAVNG
jgi:hypothetical protein